MVVTDIQVWFPTQHLLCQWKSSSQLLPLPARMATRATATIGMAPDMANQSTMCTWCETATTSAICTCLRSASVPEAMWRCTWISPTISNRAPWCVRLSSSARCGPMGRIYRYLSVLFQLVFIWFICSFSTRSSQANNIMAYCTCTLQDKVISKAIRTATDAEYLNMVLNIPSELTCSFGTPLFTVGRMKLAVLYRKLFIVCYLSSPVIILCLSGGVSHRSRFLP